MTAVLIIAAILIGIVVLLKSVNSTLAAIAIGAIVIGAGLAMYNTELSEMVVKGGIFLIIVLIAIKIISAIKS